MKLYEVPPKTWVKVPGINDPVFFDHIDGFYSYCKLGDEVIHLHALTEAVVIENQSELG